MKLTVLGCNGPYPAAGGACSGYLLVSDDARTRILIDCGTGVLSNLYRYTPWGAEDLSAVCLSHLHYDHMSDMLPLHYALQFHPPLKPIDVFAPDQPEHVRALLAGPALNPRAMEPTQIGSITLSFCAVRHPVPTFAIAAEGDGRRFVFTGDSNTCQALDDFCAGADLLLADAGFSTADYGEAKPHLSAALCGELALRAGAKRLLLTHFNPKYDPAELEAEARAVFPNTQACRIGTEYAV